MLSRNISSFVTLPHDCAFAIIELNASKNYAIYFYYNSGCVMLLAERAVFFRIRYFSDVNALCFYTADRFNFFKLGISQIMRIVPIYYGHFVRRLRVKGRLYRIYKRNKYRDFQYRFGYTHKITTPVTGFYARYIRKKNIRVWG